MALAKTSTKLKAKKTQHKAGFQSLRNSRRAVLRSAALFLCGLLVVYWSMLGARFEPKGSLTLVV